MGTKRAPLDNETKARIDHNAELFQTNENGEMVSPNGTGQVIDEGTKTNYGHVNSFESRYETAYSDMAGLTQEEHNEMFTNPGQFQVEPEDENKSHEFENHDKNDAMQNISAYACGEDPNIAANTYINPPSAENENWTISVVNAQTGEEHTLSEFQFEGSAAPQTGTEMNSGPDPSAGMENANSDNGITGDSTGGPSNDGGIDGGNDGGIDDDGGIE